MRIPSHRGIMSYTMRNPKTLVVATAKHDLLWSLVDSTPVVRVQLGGIFVEVPADVLGRPSCCDC
jgi:hypothetical protein